MGLPCLDSRCERVLFRKKLILLNTQPALKSAETFGGEINFKRRASADSRSEISFQRRPLYTIT